MTSTTLGLGGKQLTSEGLHPSQVPGEMHVKATPDLVNDYGNAFLGGRTWDGRSLKILTSAQKILRDTENKKKILRSAKRILRDKHEKKETLRSAKKILSDRNKDYNTLRSAKKILKSRSIDIGNQENPKVASLDDGDNLELSSIVTALKELTT